MISLLQVHRGWAALLVVLFHTAARLKLNFNIGSHPLLDLFYFGDAGVQFFFVLSGFIIYHIHQNDLGNRHNLIPFMKKRVVRIYPIYILITLVVFPIWFFVPSVGFPYHKDISALIYSLLLIPQQHAPHLSVAWTLTHEMLFYLVFSLLILHRTLGATLLCIWFGSICLAHFIMGTSLHYPADFLFSVNNILFGLGIIGAILANRLKLPEKVAITFFAAGNLLFLLVGAHVNSIKTVAGTNNVAVPEYAILLFGMASLLIVFQAMNPGLEKIMKSRKLMLLLGNSSYSIYLFHLPVLSFVVRTFSYLGLQKIMPIWILFLLAVAIALFAGVTLHLLIEKPLLKWLRTRWINNKQNTASIG